MNIHEAVKKITDRADAMPPNEAKWFIEENVLHHQDLYADIIERDVKPKGWSSDAHYNMIAMLITAQGRYDDTGLES